MKTEKLVQLAAVALLLCSAAAGCSKKPQNTTVLHGQRPGMINDRTSGLIDPGMATATNPEGIPASNLNFDNMTPDRDAFRDQTVYFALDQATIRSSEIPKLEQVASQMKSSHAGKALRIEGHCDERGTEEYNRALGDRRAASVREALKNLGLDPNMIQTITFGEERPQTPGHDESAWSKNRRGELILLTPPTAQGGTQ
jgi:peptidoglycan-associated lipoprotein